MVRKHVSDAYHRVLKYEGQEVADPIYNQKHGWTEENSNRRGKSAFTVLLTFGGGTSDLNRKCSPFPTHAMEKKQKDTSEA